MFISRQEAEERLRRQENILKPDPVEVEVEEVTPDIDSDQPSAPDELDILLDNAMSLTESRRPGHIRGQRNSAHFANRISDQKAIADVAIIAGDSVARDLFGLSVQQANAYEKGQRSSDRQMGMVGDGELLSHVTKTKEHIRRLAAKKLEATLDHLTDDKISSTTRATDIGRLAKDLASVHDKMERKEAAEAGVQFHVFVPEVKQITNYNVIRISSEPRVKDSEQI